MKLTKTNLVKSLLLLLVGLTQMTGETQAAGKPTSSSSTSSSSTSSGGGGGNRHSTPTPVPAVSLLFNMSPAINGLVPQCAGSYSISPYYPTLSLLTLNLQVSSLNVPNGTTLYVKANGPVGTVVSGALLIGARTGSYAITTFCSPSTTIQTVVVTDVSGAVVFTGH